VTVETSFALRPLIMIAAGAGKTSLVDGLMLNLVNGTGATLEGV
jgi:hypothetical protein